MFSKILHLLSSIDEKRKSKKGRRKNKVVKLYGYLSPYHYNDYVSGQSDSDSGDGSGGE